MGSTRSFCWLDVARCMDFISGTSRRMKRMEWMGWPFARCMEEFLAHLGKHAHEYCCSHAVSNFLAHLGKCPYDICIYKKCVYIYIYIHIYIYTYSRAMGVFTISGKEVQGAFSKSA